MAVVLRNNVRAQLAESISASDITIQLVTGQGEQFPTLGPSDHYYITLVDTNGNYEIAKVTYVVGDTLSAIRGAEGTVPRAFVAGSLIELRVTAQGVLDAAEDASIAVAQATADAVNELVYDQISDDIAAETTSKTYAFEAVTGQTEYDFGEDPGPADRLIVFVDGAYKADTDWTLSGTNLVIEGLTTGQQISVVALALSVRNSFVTRVQSGFPGDTPEAYTSSLTGRFGSVLSAPGETVLTQFGLVRRLRDQDTTILTAERAHIREDEVSIIDFVWQFERAADPATGTPTISYGLYFLDANHEELAGSEQVLGTSNATELDGLQRFTARVSYATTDPAFITPPLGAVYVAPFVRYGNDTGAVDVLRLAWWQSPEYANSATEAYSAVEAEHALEADVALYVEAENVNVPGDFQWPQSSIPEFPISNTFYVAENGDDSNSGTSTSKPLATINAAIAKMAANGSPCTTVVHPGEYVVQPDTVIPAGCALYGYDLRVTTLRLPDGQEVNNMFQMSNGIKARGFTFKGLQHDNLVFDPVTETFEVPEKGWAFVFKPGEYITRSPYIADCSQLHDFGYAQMVLPIDRANQNPDMPLGGGNALIDGNVLDPDSPLRSIVVDSFTAINPNGVGYAMVNNAFVQLVSVFTNWSRVGLWCHNGGHVTVANSNCTFGDYALAATGYRYAVQIEGVANPENISEQDAAASTIDTTTDTLVSQIMAQYQSLPGWDSAYDTLAERDTRTILRGIANDLRAGQDRNTRFTIEGFFDWNANFAFDETLVPLFVASWDKIRIVLLTALGDPAFADARTMVTELITLMTDVVNDIYTNGSNSQYVVAFGSVVEATGQQFSYAGSGVNYNSLPYSQRGTGIAPDPASTIIEASGGRVYATFSTEVGDTYLGQDLRVDFERSTIEGQAFSRGVQNITLPLTIALGG